MGGNSTEDRWPPPPAKDRVDLETAMWRPIEGITLDKYAQITATLDEQRQRLVENLGLSPGTWVAVRSGWDRRMDHHPAVGRRYRLLRSEGDELPTGVPD